MNQTVIPLWKTTKKNTISHHHWWSPRTFLFINDVVQVISSIGDVAIDIAVLLEFRDTGKTTFFYLSLMIFFMAQVTYAIIFTIRYGALIKTTFAKFAVFCVALVFGQLLPLFVFVESYHIDFITDFMRRLGLLPSYKQNKNVDAKDVDDDEQVWGLIREKSRSNFGFLVEALVEALPQSILQTACVVMYGDASVTIVCSIALSCFVIVSKSYLFCYSVNPSTFLFNSLAVTCDVTAVFAAIIFAFASCSPGSLDFSSWDSFVHTSDAIFVLYFMLVSTCTVFAIITYGCLILFSCFDDHLKYLRRKNGKQPPITLPTESPCFDIYFLRHVIFLCSCIPMNIIILAVRSSIIPLLFCRIDHQAYYCHPSAFRRMYDFVHCGKDHLDKDLRITDLNSVMLWLNRFSFDASGRTLLWHCIKDKAGFVQLRQHFIQDEHEMRNNNAAAARRRAKDKVKTLSTNDVPQQVTEEVQQHPIADVEKPLGRIEARSIIYRWMNRATFQNKTRWEEFMEDDWMDKLLRVLGSLFLVLFLILSCLTCPCIVVASLVAGIVPFWGAMSFLWHTNANNPLVNEAILGLTLTAVSFVSMLGMMMLWNPVSHFQSVVKKLERFDIRNIPIEFISVGMDFLLDEAYQRHRVSKMKKTTHSFLDQKVGQDCVYVINGFLPEHESMCS